MSGVPNTVRNVHSALDRITRPPILTVFATLQAGLVIAIATVHLMSLGAFTGDAEHPGTGDYLAFHVGATIVREGRGEGLYDFGVQRTVREHVIGPTGRLQPYLNPPALAIALAPMTRFGYVPAFLVFTLGMVVCFAGMMCLGRTTLPRIRATPWGGPTAALLAAGYLPVALTMFGGQNTVLTMFLMMGVFWALRKHRSGAAGTFVGLLSYKPQFALLPGLLLVCRKDWRGVSAAAGVLGLHYALGAVVAGPAWPLEMLAALSIHAPLERTQTTAQQFSLTVALHRLLPDLAARGLSLVAVAGAVSAVWWYGRRIDPAASEFPAFFGLVIAATMAISPHLHYYEAGLFALIGVLTLETRLHSGALPLIERLLLLAAYLMFPFWKLGESVGFQPLVSLLVVALLWTAMSLPDRRTSPTLS